jgi:hypothetical protein
MERCSDVPSSHGDFASNMPDSDVSSHPSDYMSPDLDCCQNSDHVVEYGKYNVDPPNLNSLDIHPDPECCPPVVVPVKYASLTKV